MKNQFNSIKRKILTCVSVSIIVLVVVLTSIMIYSSFNLADDILLETLQPMARTASLNVSSNLHLLTNQMLEFSENDIFVNGNISARKKEELLISKKDSVEYVWIGLFNLEGEKLIGDEDVPDYINNELYYEHIMATNNMVIGEPRQENDLLQIPIAAPIKMQGDTKYLLVGSYKYDLINDVLSNINLGVTGSAFIINEDGLIIADKKTSNIAAQVNIYDQYNSKKNQILFDKILNYEVGSTKQKLNGVNYYMAYSPVPGTNWSMVIEVPTNEYLQDVYRAIFFSIIISLIILVVAAVAIFNVVKKISASLHIATERLDSLAEGNLNDEVTITDTMDESYLLTSSLSTTIKKMNHYIHNIKKTLGAFSDGDYGVEVPDNFQGDFKVIRKSLIKIAKSLNRLMRKVDESSSELAENSYIISDLSKDLFDNSNNQNDAIERLKGSVDDIKSHITDVVDSADQVTEFASTTNTQVEEGNQLMDELLENMNNINSGMEKIQEISEMIEKISAQTRLLSFNASIEAGRAGESGKGFAVVASQIGILAGETATALQSTSEIIEQTNKVIENGMQAAGKTAQSLQSIKQTTENFITITDKLDKAVTEQQNALDMVNQEVDAVKDIAESNLLSVHKTDETASNFMEQSATLKEFVQHVKFYEDNNQEEEENEEE